MQHLIEFVNLQSS